jgi:hypothetical protein
MGSPPQRKGRPLLVAAAGIAFVSFAGCRQAEEPRPVGNLRPVEPLPTQDAGETPPPPAPSASASPASGGSGGGPAVVQEPSHAPVGNLRPPDPVEPQPSAKPTATPLQPLPNPHPVGNLRLPAQK